MTKTKLFLILTGYQLTWLACIFGEKNYSDPLIGFFTGLIFLLIYFTYTQNKKKFIYIILSIAIPGYLFDSILVYISIYDFISTMKIGLLPIWMLVLWLSFATLFVEILVFFKNYKLIGIILSAFLGPFTYYLGYPLEIIEIYNFYLFFIFMILFWISLMYFYLFFLLKNKYYSEA